MEKKEFKGNFLTFKNRLLSKFLLMFGVALLVFLIFLVKISHINILSILFFLLIISPILPILFNCVIWIDSATIENAKVTFGGYKFDQKFTKEFNIEDVSVKIKSTGSKWNRDYYLEFHTPNDTFSVNRLQSWDYKILVKLFREFKNSKNEKVIFDDEYWLDVMEKKAMGMTSWKAVMNKGNNNNAT